MFKKGEVELELVTNDMLLMVEKGTRGRICQAIQRYAKANNKFMKNYDKNVTSSYLAYLDARPYPERISYRLTGMGTQQNIPKNQNVKLLTLICLFVKSKFNDPPKDFSINYP